VVIALFQTEHPDHTIVYAFINLNPHKLTINSAGNGNPDARGYHGPR
jgi:hypothetical protein